MSKFSPITIIYTCQRLGVVCNKNMPWHLYHYQTKRMIGLSKEELVLSLLLIRDRAYPYTLLSQCLSSVECSPHAAVGGHSTLKHLVGWNCKICEEHGIFFQSQCYTKRMIDDKDLKTSFCSTQLHYKIHNTSIIHIIFAHNIPVICWLRPSDFLGLILFVWVLPEDAVLYLVVLRVSGRWRSHLIHAGLSVLNSIPYLCSEKGNVWMCEYCTQIEDSVQIEHDKNEIIGHILPSEAKW